MLDVHPPHGPTHTWKDFFIHIATIVCGLIIAVGIEQTVEHFHHLHQLHRLEEALDQEIEQNLKSVGKDITLVEGVIRTEQANKASLEEATRGESHTLIVFTPTTITDDPRDAWIGIVGAVSATARDSGTLYLLPIPRTTYLSRLDLIFANVLDMQHQLFDQEYRVRSFAQLHSNINDLTQQQRQDMLVAVSQYQQIAEHTRYVLERTRSVLEQTH